MDNLVVITPGWYILHNNIRNPCQQHIPVHIFIKQNNIHRNRGENQFWLLYLLGMDLIFSDEVSIVGCGVHCQFSVKVSLPENIT